MRSLGAVLIARKVLWQSAMIAYMWPCILQQIVEVKTRLLEPFSSRPPLMLHR